MPSLHLGRPCRGIGLPGADGAVRDAAGRDAADSPGAEHPGRQLRLGPLPTGRAVPMAGAVAGTARCLADGLPRRGDPVARCRLSSARRGGVAGRRRAAAVYPYGQGRGWPRTGGGRRSPVPAEAELLEGSDPARAADQVAGLRLVAGLRDHALARFSTAFACSSKSMVVGSKGAPTHWTISTWLSCFGSAIAVRNSA